MKLMIILFKNIALAIKRLMYIHVACQIFSLNFKWIFYQTHLLLKEEFEANCVLGFVGIWLLNHMSGLTAHLQITARTFNCLVFLCSGFYQYSTLHAKRIKMCIWSKVKTIFITYENLSHMG